MTEPEIIAKCQALREEQASMLDNSNEYYCEDIWEKYFEIEDELDELSKKYKDL